MSNTNITDSSNINRMDKEKIIQKINERVNTAVNMSRAVNANLDI